MAYNYTLSCNHGEYLEGLFKNETDANGYAEALLMNDSRSSDYEEIKKSKEEGWFDELLDGYGYRVMEICETALMHQSINR